MFIGSLILNNRPIYKIMYSVVTIDKGYRNRGRNEKMYMYAFFLKKKKVVQMFLFEEKKTEFIESFR